VKEKITRYGPGQGPKPESRTDWDRLDRMTDEEVERAALDDPDAQPLSEDQLARAFRPGALTSLRKRLRLSQAEFAKQFMLNLRTLQDWEQGRRAPENIARAYLRVIEWNPETVRAALRPTQRTPRNTSAVSGIDAAQTSISVFLKEVWPQFPPPNLQAAQQSLNIGSPLTANSNNPSVSSATNGNLMIQQRAA
jgi:putative transcriptional regulator